MFLPTIVLEFAMKFRFLTKFLYFFISKGTGSLFEQVFRQKSKFTSKIEIMVKKKFVNEFSFTKKENFDF